MVGYYETTNDSHEAACNCRARTEIDRLWQEAIRTFTVGNAVQYDSMLSLEHYFYLGDDRVMCPPSPPPGSEAPPVPPVPPLPPLPPVPLPSAAATAGANEHGGVVGHGPAVLERGTGGSGGGAGLASGGVCDRAAGGDGLSAIRMGIEDMIGGGGSSASGGGDAVGIPSSGGACSAGGSGGAKLQEYTGGGQLTWSGRKRICFTMKVAPEAMPAYIQMHQVVWPEMQEMLVSCGWHNYSLFYRADGQLVGYYETDNANHEESCRKRRESAVDGKWQEAIRQFTPGNVMQYDTHGVLEHCFYLGQDKIPN